MLISCWKHVGASDSFHIGQGWDFIRSIESDKLSKQAALSTLTEIFNSAELTQSSLMKTAALISQFRQIDISLVDCDKYNFSINQFLTDFNDTYLSKLAWCPNLLSDYQECLVHD